MAILIFVLTIHRKDTNTTEQRGGVQRQLAGKPRLPPRVNDELSELASMANRIITRGVHSEGQMRARSHALPFHQRATGYLAMT